VVACYSVSAKTASFGDAATTLAPGTPPGHCLCPMSHSRVTTPPPVSLICSPLSRYLAVLPYSALISSCLGMPCARWCASRSHSSWSHPFIVCFFLDLLNAPPRKLWHAVACCDDLPRMQGSHFVLCTSSFLSNLSLRLDSSVQSYPSARASCPSVSISHFRPLFLTTLPVGFVSAGLFKALVLRN
jgi:hypothetical protein